MGKIVKYSLATMGGLVGLPLLLVVGALAMVNTDGVRRMLIVRLDEAIPGRIAWRSHHVDVLRGRISLEGLSLDGMDGSPILRVEWIELGVDLFALTQGDIHLLFGRAVRPQAFLSTDDKGVLNLMAALNTGPPEQVPPEGKGLRFRVQEFELSQAQVCFVLPAFPLATAGKSGVAVNGPVETIQLEGGSLALDELVYGPAPDSALRLGHVALELSGGRVDMGGVHTVLNRLRLEGSLDQGCVKALTLDAGIEGLDLSLRGSVNGLLSGASGGNPESQAAPSMDLAMDCQTELSALGRSLGLKKNSHAGKVYLKVKAAGSLRDPEVDLEARFGGGKLAQVAVDQVDLALRIFKRRVRLEWMRAANRALRMSAKGTVDLTRAFPKGLLAPMGNIQAVTCDLVVNAQAPELGRVGALFGVKDLSGSMTLQAGLKGALPLPVVDCALQGQALGYGKQKLGDLSLGGRLGGSATRPKGHLQAQLKALDLGGQPIPQVDVALRFDRSRAWLDVFRIALPGNAVAAAVNISGWMDRQQNYEIRLGSDPISPSSIHALAKTFPQGGSLWIEAFGKGNAINPSLEGCLHAKDLQLEGQTLSALDVCFALDNQIATLCVRPGGPHQPLGQSLALDARLCLQNKDFSAQLELTDEPLSPYFALAGLSGFSGRLSALLRAEGNWARPEAITARAQITDFLLNHSQTHYAGNVGQYAGAERANASPSPMELLRTKDLRASYEGGRLSLPISRLTILDKGFVTLQGGGGLDGALDLALEGALPASLVQSFSEALLDVKGQIAFSAKMGGKLNAPSLEAVLRLEDIGMTLAENGQRLHSLGGSIALQPGSARLQGVSGKVDDGDFTVEGGAVLKGFKPERLDVHLAARAIPIKVPGTLDALLSAGLHLTGNAEKSRMSGEITVLDGRYFRDVQLNLLESAGNMVRPKRRFEPPATEKPSPSLLDGMALDVAVRHRNPFVVDNNVAVMDIRPDLRLHGSLLRPLVDGRAEVQGGTLTFYNTTFQVERGIIDFLNPYRIEPNVDITARSQVGQWNIVLTAQGPPEDLKVTLKSTPEEEHGDILALLLVGTSTREWAKDGEKTPEGGASPSQLLANLLAAQLQKELKAGTGLDVITLDYSAGAGTGTGQEIRLTLGKALSRRLTLLYGVEQKGGMVVHRSTALYKLLEKLSLNAFQDSEGAFGGEIRYRIELR